MATRLSEDDSWGSVSSGNCCTALDFDVPARGLAGFLGLLAALLLEVDGLMGLAALLFDVEGLAGLAGSFVEHWDSGFRLTGFLLDGFNEEALPSLSS